MFATGQDCHSASSSIREAACPDFGIHWLQTCRGNQAAALTSGEVSHPINTLFRGHMYKKTRTLSVPVSPEVAAFAAVMEARLVLEGYDDVESWEGISIQKLQKQLESKAKRLAAADPTNATELFNKAVIIGNLAMMIAEKAMVARQEQLGPEAFEAQANAAISGAVPAVSADVAEPPASSVEVSAQSCAKAPQNANPPQHFRHAVARR